MPLSNRIIGRYTGQEKGPLVIVIGGLHGNEPAGVFAMERLFQMLQEEPNQNASFSFKGRLIGLRGNLRALDQQVRFIRRDLNRNLNPFHVAALRTMDKTKLYNEDLEARELADTIHDEIEDYQPEEIICLDLHTTTAYGGIFSIVSNDQDNEALAQSIHAPVIRGFLEGLKGSSLHYLTSSSLGIPTRSFCFESGQHDEPLSITRAIAAVVSLLRSVGCVKAEDVEFKHDEILKDYAMGLPAIAELIYAHPIEDGDGFEMKPGYRNFQSVKRGQLLATDRNHYIRANTDGLLLMPLYQPQGDEGFFIIKDCEK